MANLGDRTRKQQVLSYLINNRDRWVDGPEISNEETGGSEGLRRVRELIAEGLPIEARRHPSHARDIWQYRYLVTKEVNPLRGTLKPNPPVEAPLDPTVEAFVEMPKKLNFGQIAVCPRCHGRTKKHVFAGRQASLHRDPGKVSAPCIQCNGFGFVPNKGPIPITMPEGARGDF